MPIYEDMYINIYVYIYKGIYCLISDYFNLNI